MLKGEVSFQQWSYELQTLQKTYSESALSEGIQRSLKGDAADTVCNMGPDASLDTIIKILLSYMAMLSLMTSYWGTFIEPITGKMKLSPTLPPELRVYYHMLGTDSPIKFLLPRSRTSLKTDCSMAVRRV